PGQRWQLCGCVQLVGGAREPAEQERPGRGEQVGHHRRGEPVLHMVAGAYRGDHPGPFPHGQVLGQLGRLAAGDPKPPRDPSTASTWMRVGWARDLNRSALIRYSGSVARVGTENLLDLRILSSRQLRCCGEARTRGEPIAWVRTAVDLRTCAGPPRGAPMSFA